MAERGASVDPGLAPDGSHEGKVGEDETSYGSQIKSKKNTKERLLCNFAYTNWLTGGAFLTAFSRASYDFLEVFLATNSCAVKPERVMACLLSGRGGICSSSWT